MTRPSDEAGRVALLIDGMIDKLLEMRREFMAHPRDQRPQEPETVQTDPTYLVETSVACERLGIPGDHVRKLCRRGCGQKIGGRWMVNMAKAREALTR